MDKKLKFLIGIVVTAGAVIGYIGMDVLLRKQPVPAATQITSVATPAVAVSATEWKTYRNEKFGFELQYPSQLTVGAGNSNDEHESVIFYNLEKKQSASLMIFSGRTDEISRAGFQAYLTLGSVCDTRWIQGIVSGPTVFSTPNSLAVLSVKVKKNYGETATCYYAKNTAGNVLSFANASLEGSADFLPAMVDSIKLFLK